MLELLRDSIWQFIGAVLGLIAIVIALRGNLIQQKRKRIGFEVVTVSPLLTEHLQGKLRIIYIGKELSDAYMVVVKITNHGHLPIASADYERPLTIHVDDAFKILSADISEYERKEYGISVSQQNDHEAQISPTVLNPDESFEVQLLIEPSPQEKNGDGSDFVDWTDYLTHSTGIDGRIIGVIEVEDLNKKINRRPLSLVTGLIPVVIFLSPIIFLSLYPNIPLWVRLLGLSFIFLSLISWVLARVVMLYRF
jgi:hypothetical protein